MGHLLSPRRKVAATKRNHLTIVKKKATQYWLCQAWNIMLQLGFLFWNLSYSYHYRLCVCVEHSIVNICVHNLILTKSKIVNNGPIYGTLRVDFQQYFRWPKKVNCEDVLHNIVIIVTSDNLSIRQWILLLNFSSHRCCAIWGYVTSWSCEEPESRIQTTKTRGLGKRHVSVNWFT